jgi:hypothetical protein
VCGARLEQPRPQRVVEHEVVAENLEAPRARVAAAGDVARGAAARGRRLGLGVRVREHGRDREQRLDDAGAELRPHGVAVVSCTAAHTFAAARALVEIVGC